MVNRQFVLGWLIAVSSAIALAGQGGLRPSPNAPSNTTAVPVSESRMDVSWRDNSTNELGFEVHRGTTGANGSYSLLVTTSTNASSYSDGALTASTPYCYKVRA